MIGYIDWPESDQVYGADEAPKVVKRCSRCCTEIDGAPLCARCARHLRRDCQLVHLAIAAGAGVGSGTIANLRRDEEKLKEYDEWCQQEIDEEATEWRAQIIATTRWHLHEECEEAHEHHCDN